MGITAFVPARSGSKRLPDKNIRPLAGRPLLHWTLQACLEAARIDRVILSTDSMKYWRQARETFPTDRLSLDHRSAEEAGDKVKIFEYLARSSAKFFGDDDDTFVLALPTVPLRRAEHIDEAVALHEATQRPVFSATQYGFPISFAFYVDTDGGWSSAFDESPMLTGNTRGQDQRMAYHPNGALYVRAVRDLDSPDLKTLYDDALPYLMDRKDSVDIDSETDFVIAAALAAAR